MAVTIEDNKVVLTMAQAVALQAAADQFGREFVLKHHSSSIIPNWEVDAIKPLNGVVLDALAHALYVGYYLEYDDETLHRCDSTR